MSRWLNNVWQWIDFRLGLRELAWPILRHPTPRGARWWYVFGSATLTLFLVQILTGIGLALVYVPSTDNAYETLQYLNYDASLGWFLRALHNCSASGMVVMLALHMTQVFLMGAFKYPREMTWLVGVVLLLCTLGMCFSGQVLRWDQDAYWTVGVAAAMAGRLPGIGPALVHLLLGGETIGGQTLSRFFALHVFVVPGALIFFLVVHLYLVLKHGISAPPIAGQPVDPRTYEQEYEEELSRGEPFFPAAVARDAIFSALTVLAVVGLAAWLGPQGPGEPPDPTLIQAMPRPDWYFLPLFALLALSPPELEAFAIFGVAAGRDRGACARPVCRRQRGAAPAAQARGGSLRADDLFGAGRVGLGGLSLALVARQVCLERDARAGVDRQGPRAPRAGRRGGVSKQDVPQLPRDGRNGRQARTRPDARRHAVDARRVDPPGHPGGRPDAGVWRSVKP